MESPRILQNRASPQADFFLAAGMNSSVDPAFIPERGYSVAWNMLNRGGAACARPGFDSLDFELPEGRLQGGTMFTPTGSVPHLVFAVEGKVYTSRAPFASYQQLSGVTFRARAPFVFFTECEQTAVRNFDETISTIAPKRVLVMQDGQFTRAAFWDGSTNRHLDPSKKETPLGGVMFWSGNRLWVSRRGGQLVASDIGNPFSFRENQYFRDGQPFSVEGEITALTEIPASLGLGGSALLVAFTDSSLTIFQSGIRERDAWKTTQNFQKRVFDGVGCVGPRAVTQQYGQLWFFSHDGLISLDSSLLSNTTSKISFRDVEMAISKAYLSPNWLKYATLTAFDNFLLCSVPNGSAWNRHTWVMDQSVSDSLGGEARPAWASIWTGLRPVEWITGVIRGQSRLFCLSRDYDGAGRVWEGFRKPGLDNGAPVSWSFESRGHSGAGIDVARFEYAEVHLINLSGTTQVSVDYAGAYRGAWKTIATKAVNIETGGVVDEAPHTAGTIFRDAKPQSRVLRTKSAEAAASTPCSPELASKTEDQDYTHQIRVRGSGPGGVRGYKIIFDNTKEMSVGICDPTETIQSGVNVDGSKRT